jgi:hypothetical protein
MGEAPAHAPSSFDENQVVQFVCDRDRSGRSRDPDKISAQSGFMFIGDTGLTPTDFVWKQLWRDGKRPAFTYTPSRAEMQTAQQRYRESMDRAFDTATEAIDASGRRINRVGRNVALDMWVGKSEQEFAGVWGRPDRFVDGAGGVRTLYFRKGYVNSTRNGYGQVVNEDHHWCDVSVQVRNGIVKDYATSGNSCDALIK